MPVKLGSHRFVSACTSLNELQFAFMVIVKNDVFRSHQIAPTGTTVNSHEEGPTKHSNPHVFVCVKKLMDPSQLLDSEWRRLYTLLQHVSKTSSLASRARGEWLKLVHCHDVSDKVDTLHVTFQPGLWSIASLFIAQEIIIMTFRTRKCELTTVQVVSKSHQAVATLLDRHRRPASEQVGKHVEYPTRLRKFQCGCNQTAPCVPSVYKGHPQLNR